jgi:hypothetical protein
MRDPPDRAVVIAGRPLVRFRSLDAPIVSIQPYVLQGASGGWTWTGSWQAGSSLTGGQWNTITVQVPANAAVPLAELGVEIATNAAFNGAAYVDAVSW